MSILGIDVSHNNGPVNWRAAADSISFAFVKATQGVSFVDPRFAQHWRNLKAAGIPRGAYHFFDPGKDGIAQARSFLRTVRPSPGDLPPVLDIETLCAGSVASGKNALLGGIARWLTTVQAATGQVPLVYTSPGFWRDLGDPPCPGKSSLWIAHYDTPVPRIPRAWTGWTFWQFTGEGRCGGIKGYVDLSRYHGSLDDLKQLGLPARPVPKPTVPAAA